MQQGLQLATKARRAARQKLPLYLVFTATGVALTLPGALLPVLLRRWSLGDARGGALLFSFFVGCTLGSLCARGPRHRALAAGCAGVALGALALGSVGAAGAFAAMTLYGLGLGLSITATGLLISERFPNERRVQMVRLNLVWALGAACGPWLALHSPHTGRLFAAVAAAFTVAALWVVLRETTATPAGNLPAAPPESSMSSRQTTGRRWFAFLDVPWPLLALLFCVTGVEAATNGWLTAYAQRTGHSLNTTIGTATLLWVGSLISRTVHATRWAAALPERAMLAGSTLMMAAALALLVAWPAGMATLVAAGLLGLGAGPVYPVVLAAALRRREDAGIFVFAGLGSAALPLLTGAVSARAQSLRVGLLVPLTGAVGMLSLVLATSALERGRGRDSAGSLVRNRALPQAGESKL